MTTMVKAGKWIAKRRILIVLIGILLLIPSVIGTIKTRINYDILSYLPESLETVKGQVHSRWSSSRICRLKMCRN